MHRILIVDDDRECLRALSDRLRFWFRGLKLVIDTADTASDGLILAAQYDYDCLIVDIVIPGINGLKFVEQVRERQPHTPVILMSGRDDDYHATIQQLAVLAFLPKPIDCGELRRLVAFALHLDDIHRSQHVGAPQRPRDRSLHVHSEQRAEISMG